MRLGSGLAVRTTIAARGTGAVLLLTVAGCAQPPAPQAALPPNPFGYLQPASVCTVPAIQMPASGVTAVAVTVSNDGYCPIRVAKPGGGPFASFLVTAAPAHGLPLNYNYNDQSVITYTSTAGYAGPDHMTVELVPGQGQPRSTLSIAVTVVPGHAAATTATGRAKTS